MSERAPLPPKDPLFQFESGPDGYPRLKRPKDGPRTIASVPYHLVDGFFSNWPMRERWLRHANTRRLTGERDKFNRRIPDHIIRDGNADNIHRADEVFFAAMLKVAGDVRDQAAREAEKAGQRELADTIRAIPLPEWLGRGNSAPVEAEPASEPWPTCG